MKKGIKYITFFLLIFLLPLSIKAEDVYLNALEILNGINTLSFDKMNNLYTIIVPEEVINLDIKYLVDDGVDVKILGNENLEYGLNDVYINLSKDKANNSYHLIVNREMKDNLVFQEQMPLEASKTNKYTIPLIGGGYLLINIIFGYILFHKHRIK